MRRFWKEVGVTGADEGFQVTLDGKPIKTQGGNAQIVPTRVLADALAAEWAAQGEKVDPAGFAMRDLADYAIDRVAPAKADTIAAIVPYMETDTLCYRADEGDALRERQEEVWEPLVCEAEGTLCVTLPRVAGIGFAAQPDGQNDVIAAHLARLDHFQIAALQNLASLAASLVVGLAALEADADEDALFAAANLEEDWQAQLWGWDSEALKRRDGRAAGFALARRFALLAKGEGA